MNCYIVAYDLKNKSISDYEELYRTIKWYGTRAHINDSTRAIVTNQKAAEIRDSLKLKMSPSDSLFVIKSWIEAARSNVACKNERLKNNL
jgi:hypothetical protein